MRPHPIQKVEHSLVANSKNQLIKIAQSLAPRAMNLRVLTNVSDARSNGHAVAVMEQGQNGLLTFLLGAPDLSLALNFFREHVRDGRIK
jgi:hypothetical protein